MAGNNVLTTDIKYVDTAEAIFATETILGRIVWSNMTSGNALIIKNAAGVVLYSVTAGLNNDYFEFDFDGYPSTLTVDTIDGGLLLIYPYMGT